MALYTTRGTGNIPEGGIRISKSEAIEHQKKIIKKWKSLTDVVFLEYGYLASSTVTFASSFYITRLTRSLFNITSQFRIIPYIGIPIVPSILSGIWTEKKVTEQTLLMSAGCPMCLQLKFSMAQIMFAVLFPTSISMMLHLSVAQFYNTIALPDIGKDTRKAYQLCFKLLKSKALQFQILAALQIPLVFLLPYLQAKQLDKINKIILERSKNLN